MDEIRKKISNFYSEILDQIMNISDINEQKFYLNKIERIDGINKIDESNEKKLANILIVIANIYQALSDNNKALECCTMAWDIQKNILRQGHPDTIKTINHLASIYKAMDNFEKALEFAYKALDIQTKVFGVEHPSIVSTYQNLACIYSDYNYFDQALNISKKALDIQIKVFGDGHKSIVNTYLIIASIYKKMMHYQESVEAYKKALFIQKKQFDSDDSHIGSIYQNLSDVYNELGQFTEALNVKRYSDVNCDNRYYKDKYFGNLVWINKKNTCLRDIYVQPDESIYEKLRNWYSGNTFDDNVINKKNEVKIFIIYGEAGIGKTSLVANLIGEGFFDGNAYAICLRRHMDDFKNSNPWKTIKSILSCSEEELIGKVIILDGLDELFYLSDNLMYNNPRFLECFIDDIPKGIKILITSRKNNNFFENVNLTDSIIIETLSWSNMQAMELCKKYAYLNLDVYKEAKLLETIYDTSNDYTKMIISNPVLLSISIILNENLTRVNSNGNVTLLNMFFRSIFNRDCKKSDLLWQMTKEIAFQMFLNNQIVLGDSLIEIAMQSVKRVLKRNEISDYELRRCLNYLPLTILSSSENKYGIEFFHKSIGEYFTAVKIYEDYLKAINMDMEESEAWQRIFEGFRYKLINEEVFVFLNAMSINDNDTQQMNLARLCDAYYWGMKQQLLFTSVANKPDYPKSLGAKNTQIAVAFCNLTSFLTAHGFTNERSDKMSKEIGIYINCNNAIINCSKWDLRNACLSGANLQYANLYESNLEQSDLESATLRFANLCHCDLKGSNLQYVNLQNANLKKANLGGANLRYADLRYANLEDANLEGADLQYANLQYAQLKGANLGSNNLQNADLSHAYLADADLQYAQLEGADLKNSFLKGASLEWSKYNEQTVFPDSFTPELYQMIKIV